MQASECLTAINVLDLSPPDDPFTHLVTATPLDWVRLSGLPSNGLEQRMTKPRVSRYRAAWQAARAAQPGRFVISHLPLMTAAVELGLAIQRHRPPHLGFAFNFTHLPAGMRLRYLRSTLAAVEQFAVFSRYEQGLYAELFDLPAERFVPTLWTQSPPPVDRIRLEDKAETPYLCAIGGEGRDFDLVLAAARRIAPARLVIIARPHSLVGKTIPDNVEVLTNRPLGEVWGLAAGSRGVLLPLVNQTTCCGHITLVSAKLLGIPALTTRSYATEEYVADSPGVLQCEPGDQAAFCDMAQHMLDDHEDLAAGALGAAPQARVRHDRQVWASYIDEFVQRHVPR